MQVLTKRKPKHDQSFLAKLYPANKVVGLGLRFNQKIEAMNANKTHPIACQKVMDMIVSFSVSFLAITIEIDHE